MLDVAQATLRHLTLIKCSIKRSTESPFIFPGGSDVSLTATLRAPSSEVATLTEMAIFLAGSLCKLLSVMKDWSCSSTLSCTLEGCRGNKMAKSCMEVFTT